MDYEKKYKDALAHAREIHRNEEGKRKDMEFLFPELKGVDDEEIKEEIINYFECRSKDGPTRKDIHNKWIAWLKRQGNKPQSKTYTFEGKSVLEAINKIGEKKFREGDKVIIDGKVCTIKSVNEDNYIVNDENGKDVQIHFSYVDGWKLVGELTAKEMKELLQTEYEKGRADAIYEMQKPWSEEDEEMLKMAIKSCEQCGNGYAYYWLKSLKDRVQPKVELTQVDKNILEAAIAFVEHNNHFNCWRGVDKHTVLSALHSLRPQNRWKPSDDQINALRSTLQYSQVSYNSFEYLNSLFNDLLKLKEK